MKFNPNEIELEMLDYWKKHKIYEKVKEKHKNQPKFYFLDGPPYTTGKVHVGTAWNKTLKDVTLRYKRFRNYNVWDRAGYDMHGLPVENALAKELKLETKEKIKKYGVDKFVKACKSYALDNLNAMNKIFKRMAIWMDFDNAYQPITNEYISGVWWLIKKAYENGRLYKGKKTMSWCPHCQTALAKHELEYKTLKETSIYLKFKIKNKDSDYLVVWTTTPWTICFNLGVMVNPNIDYVKIKLTPKNGNTEYWYIAKARVDDLLKNLLDTDYEIVETIKGKDLEGIEYIHPLNDEIKSFSELKLNYPKVHTVVLSNEYVNTDDGTGLVHMAPGCGPEDYEVGYRNNIPAFNEIDEQGIFPDSMGPFAGWKAKTDDKKFIEYYKEKGFLVATAPVEHDYAHCWRCKSPIVFRTTEQWFFKVEDLIDDMKAENKKIKWNPEWAGSNWFNSWLENLRDNCITRQRFWGTPVPIWVCDSCGHVEVIGSIDELKEKAITPVPDDLHKPFIDEVKIKCPKCGAEMHRIPDILDVWVDSGTSSWNSLHYPQRKDLFEKYFPADFITEGKDQIRGWFNLLMVTSMVSMHKAPFKSVYMHGFINDSQGRKMSKSLKNYITPEEIIDKYGSDLMRYYFVSNSEPGLDLNYNPDDVIIKFRNINILWNLSQYILNLIETNNIDINKIISKYSDSNTLIDEADNEEKYILSLLNTTIKKVTDSLDNYDYKIALQAIESFYLELSRVYVQLIRNKIGKKTDIVIYTLWHSIETTLILLAPFTPLISEKLYLTLSNEAKLNDVKESIHFLDWPKANEGLINNELENIFSIAKNIIQIALKIRDKIGYGVRWPLSEMIIETSDAETKQSVVELESILKTQLNVKEIKLTSDAGLAEPKINWNYGSIASRYKEEAVKIIAALSTMNKESIYHHIKKNENFTVIADSKEYELTPQDFTVEYNYNTNYGSEKTPFGFVFINKNITPELFSEGFSRELIRRIQQLRKTSKLKKQDKIKLIIGLKEESLIKDLDKYKQTIMASTGSTSISILPYDEVYPEDTDQVVGTKAYTKFKVKGKEGIIGIDF